MRIIKRMSESLGFSAEKKPAGTSLIRYPNDMWIVSYPRSGNTWMRFLVGNLCEPGSPTTFANVEQRVPDIYVNTDREMRRCRRPRILKSHEAFNPALRRVLYLVRDPRAVVVSYYHYARRERSISDDYPLEAFVYRLLEGDIWPHIPWNEHVAGWNSSRADDKDFLVLRYEDIFREMIYNAQRLASFLDIQADAEQIKNSVRSSLPEQMRRHERETGHLWKQSLGMRGDVPFVRKATVDAWREEISEALNLEIKLRWGEVMSQFDYE